MSLPKKTGLKIYKFFGLQLAPMTFHEGPHAATYVMPEGATCQPQSNALLQGGHWEGLHNCLCRLCLHDLHLAEDLALPSLGCRLDPGFDHANPWNRELTRFLHLCCCNSCQGGEKFRALRLLEFSRCCQCLCKCTFGHGLAGGFHCWGHLLKHRNVYWLGHLEADYLSRDGLSQ